MLYILLAYVAWCALIYFAQDWLIFPREMAGPALPLPKGAELISIPLADGKHMEGWFFPATRSPAPAVVYFHGNAELICHQNRIVEQYHAMGFAVLLPEYRGYGGQPGSPSQKAFRKDMPRFYDALAKRADIDPGRIIFHGRSLGGGVAADLALQRQPAALILESTFASMASMGWRYGTPPFLARHPFRTNRALAQLNIPVLMFHGRQDTVIPVSNGRKLAQAARKGRYIEYDAGHNDFPGAHEEEFWTEVKTFLRDSGLTD